jgi:hypothetical protein
LGGLAALLCGVAGICGELAFFAVVGSQPFSYSAAAGASSWPLMLVPMLGVTLLGLLGLTALYARESARAGRLGLVAYVAATAGTMLQAGHQFAGAFVLPVLADGVPEFLDAMLADLTTILAGGVFLTALTMTVGWALFGIAAIRAGILPRGAAWLIIAGAVLYTVLDLAGITLNGVVLYAGIGWMGWALWSEA